MKRLPKQMLRSPFPMVLGAGLFTVLLVLRQTGLLGTPISECTMTFFGYAFTVNGTWFLWSCVSLVILSTYMLYRLSGEYAMYNVRTHFGMALFMAVFGGPAFVASSLSGMISLMLALGALFILFSTYQQTQAVGEYQLSFLLLGLATILSPKWMLLVPVFFASCGLLRSMTGRTALASLIGLITPYWIAAGVLFLCDEIDHFFIPFQQLSTFSPVDYSCVTATWIVSFVLLMFMALPALFLYPTSVYSVKEKARVGYLFLFILFLCTTLLLLLQPQLIGEFLPLLMFEACLTVTQMLLAHNERFVGTYLLLLLIIYALYASEPYWGVSLIVR